MTKRSQTIEQNQGIRAQSTPAFPSPPLGGANRRNKATSKFCPQCGAWTPSADYFAEITKRSQIIAENKGLSKNGCTNGHLANREPFPQARMRKRKNKPIA